MNDRERFELLDSILDELDGITGSVIVVEGKKDVRSLEALLTDSEYVMVQREGGPVRVAERIAEASKRAVILTDWDNKGEYLAHLLEEQLSAMCVPYDTTFRKRLAKVCRKDIKDVEGLRGLYLRLSETCAGDRFQSR